MADIRISQLPSVSSISNSDIVPVVASNNTSQITLANIATSMPTVTSASHADYADTAGTAGSVPLVAGPGITINGLEITASLRSVNGTFPTNGNVSVSLTGVLTGTSASLVVSSSGTITGSLTNGTIWVIANDPTPANNGDVYVFVSGTVGQWYPVAPLDTAAADARYIKLDGANTPLTGNLNIGGYNLTNIGRAVGGSFSGSFSGSFRGDGSQLTGIGINSAISATGSTLFSSASGIVAGPNFNKNDSIFLGIMAGRNAALASSSVFLGPYAGYNGNGAYESIFIGLNSGYLCGSSNNSIFMGSSAGNGASSADNSNFLGSGAGYSAVYAKYSTFIGNNAGSGSTNASSSNFIGPLAGNTATDAHNSNFLGNQAGSGATNSSYSNFLGTDAGNGAAGASYSNFLGTNAGKGSGAGVSNSNFIGTSAGFQTSTAAGSNFLGSNAGSQATNAYDSNFLGSFAGSEATNAWESNFLGYRAGEMAANASYSTLIGYQVGRSNGIIGISSNNIIIGTNITLPNGRKDSINLGGIIFATGSYSDTNPSYPFSGSMTNAKVGINQSLPQYTLDVSGSVGLSDVLVLPPQNPLPSGKPTGSFAVSGSGANCKPYFYNGTTWTALF